VHVPKAGDEVFAGTVVYPGLGVGRAEGCYRADLVAYDKDVLILCYLAGFYVDNIDMG
jgi:hypothetical protein